MNKRLESSHGFKTISRMLFGSDVSMLTTLLGVESLELVTSTGRQESKTGSLPVSKCLLSGTLSYTPQTQASNHRSVMTGCLT